MISAKHKLENILSKINPLRLGPVTRARAWHAKNPSGKTTSRGSGHVVITRCPRQNNVITAVSRRAQTSLRRHVTGRGRNRYAVTAKTADDRKRRSRRASCRTRAVSVGSMDVGGGGVPLLTWVRTALAKFYGRKTGPIVDIYSRGVGVHCKIKPSFFSSR